MKNRDVYYVNRLDHPFEIDAVWDKPQWQASDDILIGNYMGTLPGYFPIVKVKVSYDEHNLYVIFQVQDCCVRCITKTINGPVWEDACVEFFFSPDTRFPEKYFNLEVNCGGTPLMHYNRIAGKDIRPLDTKDIAMIEIAHSLPQIIDPELKGLVTWTLEYKVPLVLIKKYSQVTQPEPGVVWKAGFFKIAENSSNPHYLTWTVVDNPEPDFHLPQYFGRLIFQ